MVFGIRDRASLPHALNRLGARRVLTRAGLADEPTFPLPGDTPEVGQLLIDDGFTGRLREIANEAGRPYQQVLAEAAGYLREMAATHTENASKAYLRFGRYMTRAHDFVIDAEAARKLGVLDRKHSLLFTFSHRAYLDGMAVPITLADHGFSPAYGMGGANLNFFPFNVLGKRSGLVFIRRTTSGLPVYRLALRAYIAQLLVNQRNLSWSIEGGRTRTGKLRPPAFGIMRYVVDAVEAFDGPEVLIVPVSIVYEQLHEVEVMTTEARGGSKSPEDIRWLARYLRSQGDRLGPAYLDFGEPIRLRERLAALRADDPEERNAVERVALDTMHRINRATPVTTTAVVCLAMLAADRSLDLDEVLATVEPLARYVQARRWPVGGAANLTDRATIRRALQDLTRSGVLVAFDSGTETVWGIGPEQHLVAAFYRNTAVQLLVDRAIAELALLSAAEGGDDGRATTDTETMRLRDLLKFDFFFSSRRHFSDEMFTEMAIIDPDFRERIDDFGPAEARRWLEQARPLVAHLALRPYLDAYHVVADVLAGHPEDERFDEARFLDECLRVGRQWALQRRVASEESVSLEIFRPALRLARHRDLIDSETPNLAKRRQDFAAELRETVRQVNEIARIALPEVVSQ